MSDESCLDYLEATHGQKLSDFNDTKAAKDIGRLAAQWQSNNEAIDLYGSSYGTYWAHRCLQILPDQSSGVLLDAVCDLEGCDEQNGFFSTWNQTGQTLRPGVRQQLIPIPFAGHETLSNSPDDGGDCSFLIAV